MDVWGGVSVWVAVSCFAGVVDVRRGVLMRVAVTCLPGLDGWG